MKKLSVFKSICSTLLAGAVICTAVMTGCVPSSEISGQADNAEHPGEITYYYKTPDDNNEKSDDTGLAFANKGILPTASDSAPLDFSGFAQQGDSAVLSAMLMFMTVLCMFLVLGIIIIPIAIAASCSKGADSYEIPLIRPEPPKAQRVQPAVRRAKLPAGAAGRKPLKRVPQKEIDNADAVIEVLTGNMKGARVPINCGETIVLGNSAQCCQLVFDKSYESVSRVHCIVSMDRAGRMFFVTDLSTNGTYMSGRVRLTKNKKSVITGGTLLSLCNDKCIVRLVIQNN